MISQAKKESEGNGFTTQKFVMPAKLPEVPEKYRFERPWQQGKLCGPVSLYVLLNLYRVAAGFEEVREKLPVNDDGCSMADIQRAAGDFGLKLKAVRVTPEELGSLPKPCIVHWLTPRLGSTPQGHFDILLNHAEGIGYDVVDTTECSLRRMTYSAVGPRFDGYALVPARSGTGPILWLVFFTIAVTNVVFLARLCHFSFRKASKSV